MIETPLTTHVVFQLGPVPITVTVLTTWGLIAVLAFAAWLSTRRLALTPKRAQAVLELLVTTVVDQIGEAMQHDGRPFLPLIGTLFLFILVANLASLLPGVTAPTGHIETAGALALIVFLSIHWFGIRRRGLLGYLGSFAKPTVLMLPINIISEITRILSLMVRLFGNVMSGGFVVAIVVGLAGLFVPIPFMALELVVGAIQAYIFAVLSAVFIGAAIGPGKSSEGSNQT